MSLSAPLIFLGLSLTLVGVFMILLSFRSAKIREHTYSRGFVIAFIGLVPIIFGGGRKLVMVGIAAIVVLALLLVAAYMNPGIIGW